MDEDQGGWSDFKIPAVIIFGADRGVEMDQFHIENAKSISTDLALDLLKTRAKKDDCTEVWMQWEKVGRSCRKS